MGGRAELIAIFEEVREWLAKPGNDFAYSRWHDGKQAIREIESLASALRRGECPPRSRMAALFAPTGDIQEVSLSSGWAYEFLRMADKFDHALACLYGPKTE